LTSAILSATPWKHLLEVCSQTCMVEVDNSGVIQQNPQVTLTGAIRYSAR
jgi:hypothetical protein